MSESKRSSSEQRKFRQATRAAHEQRDASGFAVMTCYLCKGTIYLDARLEAPPDRWEADHVVTRFAGGAEGKPAHYNCHRRKTRADLRAIGKMRRIAKAVTGHLERMASKGETRQVKKPGRELKSRGFQQHPTLRRTLRGKVVPRT